MSIDPIEGQMKAKHWHHKWANRSIRPSFAWL